MSADRQNSQPGRYNLRVKWFSAAVLLIQFVFPLTAIVLHPALFLGVMLLKSIIMVGWSKHLTASGLEGV